ncbi:MAG: phosphoserine phosphatase SerB [Pseudomonadota bacterium]
MADAFRDDAEGGFVLVLTAPSGGALSDEVIGRAVEYADCTGNPVRRLGATAAEIATPCRDADDWVDWPSLLPGIDVNTVPVRSRRKRLLIADMDSTIIPVECIDELAAMAGVGAEVAAVTEQAMAGALDFEASLAARVALLADADAGLIERVLAERITLNPGARALVATMAAHGGHTMLVSGGFTAFAGPVGAMAGFAEVRANTLIVEEGRLTGRVGMPILGRDAKLQAMAAALDARGLTAGDALAVGDGANDLAMVCAAGLGVAFRAKPALGARADARIHHAGLDALLALQGYGEDEIVS